ncbi:MAG: glycosyltransferase family 4 protein [Chloroflexi bacterium]|nr:glycosyltransferase family 4 protein [Chloroflexota bacterium]
MPRLVINGWFWGQTTTGSGQYLRGLLTRLPSALPDWDIVLLLPEGVGSLSARMRRAKPPSGVRMRWTRLPRFARGARLEKLAWEQRVFPVECRKLGADVAFAPYWASPILPPCPTLVTIHDLIPLLLADYATKPTARAYTWLVSRSAHRAAAVLTVSQSARDDIIRHLRIPGQRVHVTYESLGYPHAPVTDAAELARVRRAYHLPPHYLFYLGGFDPRKNVPLLLRAYARAWKQKPSLPPLLIAGKLPEPSDDWFTDPRPLIAQLGLEARVRTLGFAPDEDKPALYTLADLFIFPSRYEGFGLPPLEAMACGTPALVSNSSSLPEVVGHTLPPVPVNDESALAQGILDALEHPPPRERLLAQAARFSWRDTAAIIARIIREHG